MAEIQNAYILPLVQSDKAEYLVPTFPHSDRVTDSLVKELSNFGLIYHRLILDDPCTVGDFGVQTLAFVTCGTFIPTAFARN